MRHIKLNRRSKKRIAVILTAGLILGALNHAIPSGRPLAKADTTSVASASVNDYDVPGVSGYAKVYDYRTEISPSVTAPDTSYSSKHVDAPASAFGTIDTEIDRLGGLMSDQLDAYFTNSVGANASISTVSTSELASINSDLAAAGSSQRYVDVVSKVAFQIPNSYLPSSVLSLATSNRSGDASNACLFYLEQTISRYPNLCCLFTMMTLAINNSSSVITVYSPVAVDKFTETTYQYKAYMNSILKAVSTNTSMNDVDKLLYLHDEIVAMTEYAVGRTASSTFAADYTPIGTMINNLSVCQSYSAVFNQAARSMGITSYVVDSDTHGWNAVRLNGIWYYVDTTWDDTRSYGQSKDYVPHNYFLVDKTGGQSGTSATTFLKSHTLSSEYATKFSGIDSSLGSGYNNFFPKQQGITSQMGYTGGYFYYSKDNKIYRWKQGDSQGAVFNQVTQVAGRRVSVLNNLIYISGTDGMYRSDSSLSAVYRVDNGTYLGMYEAAGRLYVTSSTGSDGSYRIYADTSEAVVLPTTGPAGTVSPYATYTPAPWATITPYATATPSVKPTATSNGIPTVPPLYTATPSASASPASATKTPSSKTPSFTAPPKTYIKKLTNSASGAAYIKWKKVKGVTHYRVQYSPYKSFTTKQIHTSLTNSVTIVNLFKNKTYYFRVRSVKMKADSTGKIYYKYSKWSKKKKLRIKK
ncbi:MAG TPA: hypothetical protein DCP06_05355 [Lachnospiraceae bacterium]|nr:hypothetical protein [Lachnospiraceae bacterium]